MQGHLENLLQLGLAVGRVELDRHVEARTPHPAELGELLLEERVLLLELRDRTARRWRATATYRLMQHVAAMQTVRHGTGRGTCVMNPAESSSFTFAEFFTCLQRFANSSVDSVSS